MSDEEDFDEFPPITVNSSIHESSSFSMPSAEELASQRAREEECERALLRLRAEHDAADRQCADAMVAALAHSDSSGSEGEAALAAAVSALRVRAARLAAPALAPRALRAALQPRLPPAARDLLAAYCDAAPGPAAALTREIAGSVSDMVLEAADAAVAWSSEEVVGVAAWLCAALASPARRAGRRALLRALHLLVDDVATDEQVREMRALLTASALEPGAALELSDALRGGGARCWRLARALAGRALAHVAALSDDQDCSMSGVASALPGAWRRLPPPRRYLALQLLARLLPPLGGEGGGEAEAEGERARRLLDALAQAAPGQRAQSTDELKVLVAATKLQVLFHLKK